MQEEQPLNPAVLGRIPVSVSQAGQCLCFWLWRGFCCFVETDESLFLTLWFPWETPCHQPPQLWQCHSWGGWLHRGQGQQLLVLAIPLHFGIRKTHPVWNSALYTGLCPSHHSIQGKDACKSSPAAGKRSQHSDKYCLPVILSWSESLSNLSLSFLCTKERSIGPSIWSYCFSNGKKWSYPSKAKEQYITAIIFKRGENVQKLSCHSRLWSRVATQFLDSIQIT